MLRFTNFYSIRFSGQKNACGQAIENSIFCLPFAPASRHISAAAYDITHNNTFRFNTTSITTTNRYAPLRHFYPSRKLAFSLTMVICVCRLIMPNKNRCNKKEMGTSKETTLRTITKFQPKHNTYFDCSIFGACLFLLLSLVSLSFSPDSCSACIIISFAPGFFNVFSMI